MTKSAELEVERLRNAIRQHRDARGDDRCWLDDEELYRTLPEGYTPPERDTAVELSRCEAFIRNRQNPATVYVSPQRRIDELESELAERPQPVIRHLASAMKKMLPPPLLAEVIAHADPLGTFLKALREAETGDVPDTITPDSRPINEALLQAFDAFLVEHKIPFDDFIEELAKDFRAQARRCDDKLIASLLGSVGEHLSSASFDWYVSTK